MKLLFDLAEQNYIMERKKINTIYIYIRSFDKRFYRQCLFTQMIGRPPNIPVYYVSLKMFQRTNQVSNVVVARPSHVISVDGRAT